MAACAPVFASVPNEQHERLAQLADAKGLSVSRLLAGLVERSLAENPEEKMKRLVSQAQDDRAAAEKYTVRLMGTDAARLEERAQSRSVTASGYVAHVLRAHLRAALAAGPQTNPGQGSGHLDCELQIVGDTRCLNIGWFESAWINLGASICAATGRKAGGMGGFSPERWTSYTGSSVAGATEVLVTISGGGRDADGVQAHLEYIDRHGRFDLETDYGVEDRT